MEKLIIEVKREVLTKSDEELFNKMMKENGEVDENWYYSHERTIRWEYPEIVFQSIKSKDELMEFLYDEGISSNFKILNLPDSLKEIFDDDLFLSYEVYYGNKYFDKKYASWPKEKQQEFDNLMEHFEDDDDQILEEVRKNPLKYKRFK